MKNNWALIVENFSQVKAPMLRDSIVAFQQFITIYVNEYRCIDDHVASATKVLGILWSSNRDCKRVCYKEFYNDAINELVDFTEDFSRWKFPTVSFL